MLSKQSRIYHSLLNKQKVLERAEDEKKKNRNCNLILKNTNFFFNQNPHRGLVQFVGE
jgi:hypothetical protein